MSEEGFEPRIVVFACNWCAYAALDLAGTSRIEYPPNVTIVRVMCSSRVTPGIILDAFSLGADAVLVAGCHPGTCHYINGNYKTIKRYLMLKKVLDEFGLGERIRLQWFSAGEGEQFARFIREFVKEVKEIGPLRGRSHD